MGFMERLEAIPILYRWLMILGILVLLAVAYWYLLYQPGVEELTALQSKVVNREQELQKHRRIAAKFDAFKAQVTELDAELRRLLKFLPKSQEIPGLIRQISDLGVRTGLQIDLLRPGTEQPQEYYARVPITVHVKGGYHAVGQFFDELRRLPRIISVGNIEMKGTNTNQETKCLATTFRYLEEDEERAEAPDKKKDRRRR